MPVSSVRHSASRQDFGTSEEEIDLLNFIGYPNAGKDTQVAHVKRIFDQHGRPYQPVGTGEALRKEKDAGSPLGLRAALYMDKGKLVPSDIINPAVRKLVTGFHDDIVSRAKLWMFNGYPRARDQVDEYLELVKEFGRRDVSFILSLGAPEQALGIMLERARKRARGPDDEPKVVRERYQEAREELDPVVERLAREGLVRNIDAAGPEAFVTTSIRREMGKLGVLRT